MPRKSSGSAARHNAFAWPLDSSAGKLETVKYKVRTALECGPLLHETLQIHAPRGSAASSSSWEPSSSQTWTTWGSNWTWRDHGSDFQPDKQWEDENGDDTGSQDSWGNWTKEGKFPKQDSHTDDDHQWQNDTWSWRDDEWKEQTWSGYDWTDVKEEDDDGDDDDDVISVEASSDGTAHVNESKRAQFVKRTGYKRPRGGKNVEYYRWLYARW